MEKLHRIIDSWDYAWDALVIVIFMVAFLVWLDVYIGNRIRITARSIPGILLEGIFNWYSLKKNTAKAWSLHMALRKRYWVVPIEGKYYVFHEGQKERINRILKKYHSRINFYDLWKMAAYWTK